MKKTQINILPLKEGNNSYLILHYSEEALKEIESGAKIENVTATSFAIKNHGRNIENIVLELEDGIPVRAHAVEE